MPFDQYRTVVAALDRLTTQVGRVADAMGAPDDDGPTTPVPAGPTTCDASCAGASSVVGPCALRYQHDGPLHRDRFGATWTTAPTTEPGPVDQYTDPFFHSGPR